MKPDLASSDGFWILSTGYRDSGDATFDLVRTDSYTGFAVYPCVFLFFRSIELALKAVLVHHGVGAKDIERKMGHRISALLKRAETFTTLDNLGIGGEDRQLLDRFSDDYADKWFEYADDFWKDYPRLEQLKDLAGRVCSKVQGYGGIQTFEGN